MNIFALDYSPRNAAKYHCDKHVVKMMTEHAQMLSTAHRILDGEHSVIIQNNRKKQVWTLPDHRETLMHKTSHANHPSTAWARSTRKNYMWLYEMTFWLCKEYTKRYGKIYKGEREGLIGLFSEPPINIREGDLEPFALAMPDECKVADPVQSYRNYYKQRKSDIAKWKLGNVPKWYEIV